MLATAWQEILSRMSIENRGRSDKALSGITAVRDIVPAGTAPCIPGPPLVPVGEDLDVLLATNGCVPYLRAVARGWTRAPATQLMTLSKLAEHLHCVPMWVNATAGWKAMLSAVIVAAVNALTFAHDCALLHQLQSTLANSASADRFRVASDLLTSALIMTDSPTVDSATEFGCVFFAAVAPLLQVCITTYTSLRDGASIEQEVFGEVATGWPLNVVEITGSDGKAVWCLLTHDLRFNDDDDELLDSDEGDNDSGNDVDDADADANTDATAAARDKERKNAREVSKAFRAELLSLFQHGGHNSDGGSSSDDSNGDDLIQYLGVGA